MDSGNDVMTYTSIMVHLDTSNRSSHRLEIAANLAAAHCCRLIGLFTSATTDPAWFYQMQGTERFIEEDRERRKAACDAVHRQFDAAVGDLPLTAEWRALDGDPTALSLREAREADLLVAGQVDPDDPNSFVAPQFLETLTLEAGRPVLVIPYAGQFGVPGKRVMLAWDGRREATRALHDALPLIAGAQASVFCAQPAHQSSVRPDASPAGHAVAALSRHGISASVEQGAAGSDLSIGEMMLSRAVDFNADLVVMGAYGHGRLRELVLGGVTRTLLDSMTLPVLMSH